MRFVSFLSSRLDNLSVLSLFSSDMSSSTFTRIFPSSGHFQHLNILSILQRPEINTLFKAGLHQWQIELKNHLFWLTGYTVSNAPLNAVYPHDCQDLLLSQVKPAVSQYLQILLISAHTRHSIPDAEPSTFFCSTSCCYWLPNAPNCLDPSARPLIPPET